MDYEKKYKEALEVAKRKLCFDKAGMVDSFTPNDIYEMFPELKESEDERIRKDIVEAVEFHKDFSQKRKEYIYAWLEKQGEQKPAWSYEDEANLNNIIWLCNNCIKGSETTWIPSQATKIKHLIETIKEKGLVQQNPAWSEEDKKTLERVIRCIENHDYMNVDDIHWLNSIKDRVGCEVNCTTTKEWSEEDMSKIQRICKYLDEAKKYYADITEVRECVDWLKSIKDRSTWKPSDEQMEAFEHFVKSIGESGYASPYENNTKLLYSLLEQLKKL